MTKEKQQQRRSSSSIDTSTSNSNSSIGSKIKKGKNKINNISIIKKHKKNYAVSIIEGGSNNNNNNKNHCCNGIKSFFCSCATIIGGMYSLVEKSDGTPIIITGPSWPMCLCCTVPMIILGSISITWFILMNIETNMPWWIIPIYISFIIGTLLSLLCTSCSNPGLVERVVEINEEDPEKGNGWVWNGEISSFQPPNSGYCRECKVLIEEYEHACSWTGTAIGKGNSLAFQVFLLFVNSLCYFSLGLIVYYCIESIDY